MKLADSLSCGKLAEMGLFKQSLRPKPMLVDRIYVKCGIGSNKKYREVIVIRRTNGHARNDKPIR